MAKGIDDAAVHAAVERAESALDTLVGLFESMPAQIRKDYIDRNNLYILQDAADLVEALKGESLQRLP